MNTLTKEWPPTPGRQVQKRINTPLRAERKKLRDTLLSKFYALDDREIQASVNRALAKRANRDSAASSARVDLAKHLRAAVPVVVDAVGERHEPAGLIKALHVAGGTPLTPRAGITQEITQEIAQNALRKIDDAAPARAAEPASAVGFDFEQMTEGEAWAHAARQERDDREEVSALMRQALTGRGPAIGGRR